MRKLLLGGLLATTMLVPAFAADVMWRSLKNDWPKCLQQSERKARRYQRDFGR